MMNRGNMAELINYPCHQMGQCAKKVRFSLFFSFLFSLFFCLNAFQSEDSIGVMTALLMDDHGLVLIRKTDMEYRSYRQLYMCTIQWESAACWSCKLHVKICVIYENISLVMTQFLSDFMFMLQTRITVLNIVQ